MNKKLIGAVVVLLIVAGGSFYGGTLYAKSAGGGRGSFSGAQFAGRTGSATGGAFGRGGAGGGLVAGQILSAGNGSITLQEQGASSTQIVLIGSATQVFKTVAGSQSDLTPGTEVTVTGTANSDGSLTAQSIQIRPAGQAGAPMIRANAAVTQ
jgi:Domain of unknown function (DUF5666)